MKKCILAFILLATLSKFSTAQQYIYISEDGVRKFLRVDLGYTQWTMQQADSGARHAQGVHLLNEVKILSGFLSKDGGFAFHDAFYFGLDLGLMTSDPHSKGNGENKETESKF